MKKKQAVKKTHLTALLQARRGTLSQFGREICLEPKLKTA